MAPAELHRWMTAHGYSVRALAGALGINPATVQRWRTGEHDIPPYLHLALERVAQIDAE